MNAAIQQRLEQFVGEILDLLQLASAESRAAALKVLSAPLSSGRRPRRSAVAARSKSRLAVSPAGRTSPKSTTSPRRSGLAPTRSVSAVAADAVAPSPPASAGAAAPATNRRRIRTNVVPVAATSPASSASSGLGEAATPAAGIAAPAPVREALVLEAVRSLVRATSSEIAERSGQPNGSVGVALRALIARGQVAKTRTARGAEYSLVSTGSVRPFKRIKGTVVAEAPARAAPEPRPGQASATSVV